LNTDIRNGPLIEIELILYIVLSEISQLILDISTPKWLELLFAVCVLFFNILILFGVCVLFFHILMLFGVCVLFVLILRLL